jgi:predicted anti-sigma-YlaC factor YlaD
LKIQSAGRQEIRKRKENEKRGKNKERRRELEKINLKCKIYALMCVNVFYLALIFCFVED